MGISVEMKKGLEWLCHSGFLFALRDGTDCRTLLGARKSCFFQTFLGGQQKYKRCGRFTFLFALRDGMDCRALLRARKSCHPDETPVKWCYKHCQLTDWQCFSFLLISFDLN